MMRPGLRRVDALIIGAGPSGLAAAIRLRKLGTPNVTVLERESVAGGVPRHCHHPNFGLREFGRLLRGPSYARRLVTRATVAGVDLRTDTSTIEIGAGGNPFAISTSPSGIERWETDALILATGCRERPRPARLIPGTRAPGVLTTGELQQLTYIHGMRVGKRAVVVGAEHIGFSALLTLRDAGITPVAMVTSLPDHQSNGLLRILATRFGSVPLITDHSVSTIVGTDRVEGIIIEGAAGRQRRVDCDTVILTGDWIAEGELAQQSGLAVHGSNGGQPQTEPNGRTSADGVFAAGSLVRPGESASRATASGREVAEAVWAYLQPHEELGTATDQITLDGIPPVRWIAPKTLSVDRPGVPIHIRTDAWLEPAIVTITQDSITLHRTVFRRMIPGHTYTVRPDWMADLDASNGRVGISLSSPEGGRS